MIFYLIATIALGTLKFIYQNPILEILFLISSFILGFCLLKLLAKITFSLMYISGILAVFAFAYIIFQDYKDPEIGNHKTCEAESIESIDSHIIHDKVVLLYARKKNQPINTLHDSLIFNRSEFRKYINNNSDVVFFRAEISDNDNLQRFIDNEIGLSYPFLMIFSLNHMQGKQINLNSYYKAVINQVKAEQKTHLVQKSFQFYR